MRIKISDIKIKPGRRDAKPKGVEELARSIQALGLKRELEIEKERELKGGQPAPAAFGRYENVFLSDAELTELQTDFPTIWQEYIERLSEYMASTGRTYKSHAATIRRWIADDRRKTAPAARDRDYSVKEGDTV